jgi:hypothetical protein
MQSLFFNLKMYLRLLTHPQWVNFDPDIRKLIVELFSYNFEQLYNFWSVVGTNYLPSVLYKVRLVRFQENAVADSNVPVEKIGIETRGK